jgi:hypothetical protein
MRTYLLLTLSVLWAVGCGGPSGEAPGTGEPPPVAEAPAPAPGGGQQPSTPESQEPGEETPSGEAPPGETPSGESPGWKLIGHEDFESLQLPSPDWSRDPVPDDGPYSDEGSFFVQRGVRAPGA